MGNLSKAGLKVKSFLKKDHGAANDIVMKKLGDAPDKMAAAEEHFLAVYALEDEELRFTIDIKANNIFDVK